MAVPFEQSGGGGAAEEHRHGGDAGLDGGGPDAGEGDSAGGAVAQSGAAAGEGEAVGGAAAVEGRGDGRHRGYFVGGADGVFAVSGEYSEPAGASLGERGFDGDADCAQGVDGGGEGAGDDRVGLFIEAGVDCGCVEVFAGSADEGYEVSAADWGDGYAGD